MRSKVVGLRLAKDVSELVIFGGDVGKVNGFLCQFYLASGSGSGEVGEMDAEALGS